MPKINPAYIQQVIAQTNQSPFPSHIGFRLVDIQEDFARVELDLAHCHLQPYGIIHGGVLATLIDTATFWAGFQRIPAEDGMVNVDLKLNYLKAVKSGKLIAEGRCLRPGRRLSYTEAHVRDESGQLVAHGTSSLMIVPGQGLGLEIPKFLAD